MINTFYDCYRVLSEVYGKGAYVSQALNTVPIEPLKRKETTKICYGVLDKDIELTYLIKQLSPKSPKLPFRIMLKIGMYCVKYMSKQTYTVTDNLVELCKKLGKGGMAGFVNAIMRNFARKEIAMPTDKKELLSVKYSYPMFALEILLKTYGEELTEQIIASDEVHNFVRFSLGVDGESYLTQNGYEFKKTPFNNLFDVSKLKFNDDFNNGVWTVQSIGSVAICDAVSKCNSVLDACSAPGGKAVLLSEKCNSVTAFELYKHRVELIKSYVLRMKRENVLPIECDASIYNKEYDGKFDAVLTDVPCSGFGTLKDNPDIKLKKTDEEIFKVCDTQFKILSTCSNYVKVGGELVYSTCSIFKQENDDIIEKFLSKNTNFEVEKIQSKLEGKATTFGLQFLPQMSFGAGFYVCKLRRTK